jgi:hypothetical protein
MTSVETSEEELTNLPTRRELKSHTTIPSVPSRSVRRSGIEILERA